jgi:hypothetical protein
MDWTADRKHPPRTREAKFARRCDATANREPQVALMTPLSDPHRLLGEQVTGGLPVPGQRVCERQRS